jgi:hypothetical protein
MGGPAGNSVQVTEAPEAFKAFDIFVAFSGEL